MSNRFVNSWLSLTNATPKSRNYRLAVADKLPVFMGFTPVDKISIERDYDVRVIKLSWADETLAAKHFVETFPFDKEKEAFARALEIFSQRCM